MKDHFIFPNRKCFPFILLFQKSYLNHYRFSLFLTRKNISFFTKFGISKSGSILTDQNCFAFSWLFLWIMNLETMASFARPRVQSYNQWWKNSSLSNSYLICSSQLLPIKIIIIYAGEKAIDRRLHKARELVQWLFNWQVIEYASGQQVARWPKRLNKKKLVSKSAILLKLHLIKSKINTD